jgi:vacuolar protein sorting-associated protein IST1
VQRLRTLQEKKGAQAKTARRDIATLLERGKTETARIKVESSNSSFISRWYPFLTVLFSVVINEDIHLELLELMELYCELLIARFGLVELKCVRPRLNGDALLLRVTSGFQYARARPRSRRRYLQYHLRGTTYRG